MGTFSGFIGNFSGANELNKAAGETRKLASLNASFIDQESKEQVRRLTETHDQIIGQTVSSIGASGFDKSGSNQQYLIELENQFQGEKDWMEKSSKSRQKIALYGGDVQAKTLSSQATAANTSTGIGIASFFL